MKSTASQEPGASVAGKVVLQCVVREFVLRHVCERAPDELLSGQILVGFEGRGVDQFVENAPDIGVVRCAAPDHHALEDSGMICRGEEAGRRAHIGRHDVRSIEAERIQNTCHKFAQPFRGPNPGTAFGKTEGWKVHGDQRAQFRERIPGRQKRQDTFRQGTQEKNRLTAFSVVGGEADLQPVDGLELERESALLFGVHRKAPFSGCLFCGGLKRSWMTAERGHLDFHERVEGKRVQNLVEFGRTVDIENANVRVFAGNPPKMQPLVLKLELLRALVFPGAQLFDLTRVRVVGNTDRDADVK
jgi:hypothetical protein